jgi:hypothetical protein
MSTLQATARWRRLLIAFEKSIGDRTVTRAREVVVIYFLAAVATGREMLGRID